MLDSGSRNAPSASAGMAAVSIHTAAQCVLATVAASHFAELAAMGFFDPAAEADVGKKLDDVLKGLRAVEGLEAERLAGCVSRGFASVDFTRLVEEAVKAKLKAGTEAKRLIRAKLVGEAARGAVGQGDLDRFAANAAAAVETVLGLVYEAMKKGWDAVARSDVTGQKNYVHVDKEFAEVFGVRERDVVQFLRYDVGDIAYGDARAEGVVVLVFLGGEKSIRVEVLAKSVAGLPIRFEEMEWGGERWTRLATARVIKPSGAENYVAQIKPRLRLEDKVGGGAGVEGFRGLLVTDASGKRIETPDPLLAKLFIDPFKEAKVEVAGISLTQAGLALIFRAVALDDKPFRELFGDIAERYGRDLWEVVDKAKGMWLETMRKLYNVVKCIANEAAKVGSREGVEAGRRALVEGLRRLFEEKEREALNAGCLDNFLAIAVAGRLTLGIVNSQREWLSL